MLPHEVELVESYSVVDINAVDKAAEEDMPEEEGEEPAATVAVTVCIVSDSVGASAGRPSSLSSKKFTCISMCSSVL